MATSNDSKSQKHEDLIASPSTQPRAPNPFAQSSNITVSVPESVEVRLVDASVLTDYEVWSFLTSILVSAFVGFLVAWLQAPIETRTPYGAFTGVLVLLTFLTGGMALAKRRSLSKNTRKLRFSVGDQLPSGDS